MDALPTFITLPTCPPRKTTHRADYVAYPNTKFAVKCMPMQQTDESLISGHYVNNLDLKERRTKSKTWPTSKDWIEDYRQYISRLKNCKNEVYNRVFRCPQVNIETIEQMFQNLDKSTYQLSYSPNDFVPLRSKPHEVLLKDKSQVLPNLSCDTKFYQTTYSNYYDRLREDCFKPYLSGTQVAIAKPKDNNEFDRVLQKPLTKYNASTYFDTICKPALNAANGNMPTGPIDRYTLRKY